jgi:DnaA-homolog protein
MPNLALAGQPDPPRMKQLPLPIAKPATAGFDTFVAGANSAAVFHLEQLGAGATPVYLWGPSGSGKTHLLRALAVQRQLRGEQVGWFDRRTRPPWSMEAAHSLLLLDDCDQFDEAQQRAAFGLLVDAQTRGVPWIAAGRLPPVDLPLREDLRTRLGWGPVFALQSLPEDQVRAVLRRESDRRGIFLSDDVMDYLLTRFARDLSHLMDLLDRLDEFALAERRAVTVPLLKKMLAEQIESLDAAASADESAHAGGHAAGDA